VLACECGGFNRPGVVLFGEPLPLNAIHQAKVEAKKADLFIVLGSSLQVAPANVFPMEAKRNGAKLVIVNEEETDYDKVADLV
ncbi:Sir2 family NAD-dependent protein deacetylase, partial [Staphylococcus sp. SIMBA_130]